MTATSNPRPAPGLAGLFRRFLDQRINALETDLGSAAVELTEEVLPYDAGGGQPVDALLAWRAAQLDAVDLPAPDDWGNLVATREAEAAVVMCLGNYPHLLRSLQPLWQTQRLSDLLPNGRGRPLGSPSLLEWAERTLQIAGSPRLLARGVLRLARHFDRANAVQDVSLTEQAALHWHQGRTQEAAAIWETLPESVPVLFNRGVATLFTDQSTDARPLLERAVAGLSDANPWHHLGRLYLTLAEMRG